MCPSSMAMIRSQRSRVVRRWATMNTVNGRPTRQRDSITAFSVELSKGNGDYELRPSMRHAHSAEYVTTCLATNGLESLETKTAIIRMDGDSPIEGLLTVAGKSANT